MDQLTNNIVELTPITVPPQSLLRRVDLIRCKKCYQERNYLNGLQICNSCCNQWEQEMPIDFTPIDFRPYIKYEKCRKCYRRNDNLNGSQICNSCCNQMEQMTPSGLKPNFRFMKCKRHHKRSDYLNEFQICYSCCNQMEQKNQSGFKSKFKYVRCRKCHQRSDYLNDFQICGSCCNQMEQKTPSGFKPNIKYVRCRKCHRRRNYLNDFNECNSCEKCNRCNDQRKDYLNGSQICNLCYKQIEQITPSGYKPNFKFMECKRCHQRSDYLNEFNECNSCEKCNRCNDQRKDLNGFQICNSCYKQIEQITPSDYKPNFKFMECKRCLQRSDYLNEFQICNSCSSRNKIIDDFLTNRVARKMEFVPYNRFKDIEFIAEGGFSKIHKATWSHDDSKMTVALKELSNSKNINFKELNELDIYNHLKDDNNINRYYGISQDPITQNFMIIMKYYKSGDLTHYITNRFFILSWYYKLSMLGNIIIGLKNIHDANIVHKDYHSGNIFIGDKIVTGDLGISKSAMANDDNDDDNEIYGIIPYVAPEIFQGQKYTKASDIYSFGMIMWELMTGRRPFWDQNHDADLIIEICDGFRPPIVNNIPKGYIELMQECWHSDPNKRPTAVDLINKITTIKNNEYKNPTKIIKSSDIGPITANNPCAIYKSRSLRAMIKSAESTRSLKSQKIISEIDKKDKRKFDDNLIEDRIIKKIRQSENNDYLTKELGFDVDIDIDSNQSKSSDYLTKEFDFDI